MRRKERLGCPKGAPGTQGMPYGHLESAFEFAERTFGVTKERILLGYRELPPNVTGYDVYIYYNGGGAEVFVFRNKQWINWSYNEQ